MTALYIYLTEAACGKVWLSDQTKDEIYMTRCEFHYMKQIRGIRR